MSCGVPSSASSSGTEADPVWPSSERALAPSGRPAANDAPLASVAGQAVVVMSVALLIPLAAFAVLRGPGGLARADAASIAAHYGSVSVVTFAVAVSFLARTGLDSSPTASSR